MGKKITYKKDVTNIKNRRIRESGSLGGSLNI